MPPPPPPGRQEASPGDQRAPPTPPPHTGPRAGGGAAPPPPPPPPHPRQLGGHRRGPPPPQGRGGAPPLRRNGDAVRATAAGPAPANPHWRAGATRTTEQEGGRAPHDPPVTTAHSRVTEGGFRSAGAFGGAVHGPTPTLSHPGATLQPRPHARAGGERAGDTERAGKEYRRPPLGARTGRLRRDTPPPPRPPTSPPAAGALAPTPRGRVDGPPPAREGSRSVTRPPAPAASSHGGREEQAGPRLRTGTPHRSYPEKGSGMGGHAPHGQHTSGGAGDGPDGGCARVGGGAGPPDPRPPHGTARRMRACHLPREGVRRQRAREGTCCPAAR